MQPSGNLEGVKGCKAAVGQEVDLMTDRLKMAIRSYSLDLVVLQVTMKQKNSEEMPALSKTNRRINNVCVMHSF